MDLVPKLRLMIIGKRGREHDLAWRLSQSPLVERIFVVPGSAWTGRGLDNVGNLLGIELDDYESLMSAAERLDIGLVVVGPDAPIVDGIEGCFRRVRCANESAPILI